MFVKTASGRIEMPSSNIFVKVISQCKESLEEGIWNVVRAGAADHVKAKAFEEVRGSEMLKIEAEIPPHACNNFTYFAKFSLFRICSGLVD